jgi:HTH-type transcriptional regulator / antitoxin MqsA
MYKENDKCPICGQGSIERNVIDETFEYKGQTLVIPDYVVFSCGNCEESIVDNETLKNTEKSIRDFHRKVDGLLTSDEIKKIRTSLAFTQEAFGNLLGGGTKGFARYETGTVSQSKAMDNLLRIVDAHPFVLDVLIEKKDDEVTKRTFSLLELSKYNHKKSDKYYKSRELVEEQWA